MLSIKVTILYIHLIHLQIIFKNWEGCIKFIFWIINVSERRKTDENF